MLIFVFGDSIVYGSWDEEGGWVDRLKREINQRIIDSYKQNTECYFQVFNLGISGDTTSGVLKRFENEIIPRLDENQENLIIFAVGINDSQYRHDVREHKVPFEEFKKNLPELLKLARKYSSKIYFVGLTNVDEEKTAPLEWNDKESYLNEYVEKYNQEIRDFCKKESLTYIEIPELSNNYLEDGLHPNSGGHRIIFDAVSKAISSILK